MYGLSENRCSWLCHEPSTNFVSVKPACSITAASRAKS